MTSVRSREFFADPVATARAHPCPALQLRAATGRGILVRDLDEIWRILVTDAGSFTQGKWKRRARRFLGPTLNTLDGPDHRERRLLLQPALERRRLASLTESVTRRVEVAVGRWPVAEPVALRSLLDPLSVTIAGDLLLGVDIEPVATSLSHDLATVMTGLARLTPSLPGSREGRALTRVHRQIEVALASRGDESPTDDLAGILLGSGLSRKTVVGEVTAFLLAAADEPPSGLAAIFYFLSLNPEIEARLRDELDRRETTGDQPVALVDAVIAESLRLLPPARHIDRQPRESMSVSGVEVGRSTNILLSPTVTHLDEAVFVDPDRFDPDRWLETPNRPARSGYLPFGAGAHSCIGEHLARLVMTTVLSETVARRRVLLEPGSDPPIPGRKPLIVRLEGR